MSKTDKDRPSWVRAKDEPNPGIWHHYRCETTFSAYKWRWPALPCDIDTRHQSRCHYYEAQRAWCSAPPNWYRHARWYNPERNNVRMDCLRAMKEYASSGDTDVIVSTSQHRHGASWDWM